MSWSSMWNGCAIASCSFCAMCPSTSGSSKSSTITMNSSPPRRASRSVSRSAADSARVTCFSSSSPMRWPSVSLTFLKRSRSMNSTPTRRPERRACAIACASRSCSSRRLGRPVRASRVAMYCSRSSAWIRALTSWTKDRIDTMRPASSSRHEWYHSHQIVSPSIRWLRVRPVARGSSPPTSLASIAAVASRSDSWISGFPDSGIPSTSSARQPKMFSACGDQRTSRKSRSHSSTASGVLLMCEESIQLARRSASSLRFSSWMSVCTA